MFILELEKIGSEWPWVARILGTDPQYRFNREFLSGQTDFRQANLTRTRGVYKTYTLEDGVYEICNPKGWRRTVRYFARIQNGSMKKISPNEALELAIEMEMSQPG